MIPIEISRIICRLYILIINLIYSSIKKYMIHTTNNYFNKSNFESWRVRCTTRLT